MNEIKKAKIWEISAMLIFGSIGLFVKNVSVSSQALALIRAVLAIIFLALVIVIGRKRVDFSQINDNYFLLFLSGTAMAFNWIFLFESYKYTSIAISTLCYYMAPIIVIVMSPAVLGEKLTLKKIGCVIAAAAGMAGVSGVLEGSIPDSQDIKGMLLGLCAAAGYATVMLLNKKMKPIGQMDRTLSQLVVAAIIMAPYCLVTKGFAGFEPDFKTLAILAVIGFFHTGFAYYLYFGAVGILPSQTTAMISYLDPVVAVILSAVILRESITFSCIVGAVLILAAALANEIDFKSFHQDSKTDGD